MNWFEHYFPLLVENRQAFAGLWYFLTLAMIGSGLAMLIKPRAGLTMRIVGVVFSILIVQLLPDAPFSFLEGRIAGLQDEVLILAVSFLVGVLSILSFLRHKTVGLLSTGIALSVATLIAVSYHMLLINGLDQHYRSRDSKQLEVLLASDIQAPCQSIATWCGTGAPQTGHDALNRDITDWTNAARTHGYQGTLSDSDGTISANPSFIWAARIQDGQLVWIARDYSRKTDMLEAVYFFVLAASTAFWFAGATLVEYLHFIMIRARRAARPVRWRRKLLSKFL